MSAVVTLTAQEAKELFGTLSYLVPSKSEATPIGLQLSNNRLRLTLNNGYIAAYEKEVSSIDEWESTFLYQDSYAFITGEEGITLECDDYGVSLLSETCECVFPNAYSVVGTVDFHEYEFKQMPSIDISEIRSLLKLNLEKIYKMTYPVYIRDGIAIVKYPSFYAQARVLEPFSGISLSLAHWGIIDKFAPTTYSQWNSQCLVIGKGSWTVMLPCTTSNQENNFMPLLEDMSPVFQMNLHNYAESIRILARVKGVEYCDLTIYPHGLRTTARYGNTSTAVRYGNVDDSLIGTYSLPINVWIAMLNAIGDSTAELLLGGGKLCLRNRTVAMLLRVAA